MTYKKTLNDLFLTPFFVNRINNYLNSVEILTPVLVINWFYVMNVRQRFLSSRLSKITKTSGFKTWRCERRSGAWPGPPGAPCSLPGVRSTGWRPQAQLSTMSNPDRRPGVGCFYKNFITLYETIIQALHLHFLSLKQEWNLATMRYDVFLD